MTKEQKKNDLVSIRSKTIGAALLITGCCTGAGMLGMPVMSGPYGFFPSLMMFFIGYIYMVSTGFLLTDLLIDEQKEGCLHIHLLSLVERILGKSGRNITWILFGFLFYAVLTAYTIGSAKLIGGLVTAFFPSLYLPFSLYAVISASITGLILSRAVYSIDYINRFSLFALILVYGAIIAISVDSIDSARINRIFWSPSLFTTLPVIVFSFGYHNLVPTVAAYLEFRTWEVKKAILIGTAISLLIYLLWEIVIFGIIPFSGPSEWYRAIQSGEMVTDLLNRSLGHSKLAGLMELFAFFAIITSYITVGMSMVHFLEDAIQSKQLLVGEEELPSKSANLLIIVSVLIPPLLITLSSPDLFLTALNYSGGVIAMILFGIIPVLCRMKKRAQLESKPLRDYEWYKLWMVLFGAIAIISIEIMQQMNK